MGNGDTGEVTLDLSMSMLAQAVGRFPIQYRAVARPTRDFNMTTLTIAFGLFSRWGLG